MNYPHCTIIDTGHKRQRDLEIEVTSSPLEAVMATEVWVEIYNRLEQLIEQHRTSLIFVNTHRLAERAAAALAERLGEDYVTVHHGSLAKEHRLAAEQRLKQGTLKALVATASLELGIDIGDVDLVCQLGSPHAISTFLQRVGRSGHQLGTTPKGRLFPLSRDDLVECTVMLAAIQQESFVIQGKFTQGDATEWCERRLLARIHRYTLKQLRTEIEPVAPADFMRFLFHWHGLDDPGEGEAALQQRLLQLEGLCLPAISWEADILPARIHFYLASDLDKLCSSGKITWLRLHPPAGMALNKRKNPAGKSTSISFISRANLPHWRAYAPLPAHEALDLSGKSQKVYAALKQWGASFFEDLLTETGLLKSQLEEALAELAAWGLVTADSFQGLRTLITTQKVQQRRSKKYPHHDPFVASGRWSLIRASQPVETDRYQHCEHIARVLLRRYGIVFRKLLDQEDILPPWRELLYVFRRMEARGELRGGRFVQGFAGEQYALPEAVNALREIRKQSKKGDLVAISAADPLNLTGLVTPGQRVPSQPGQRILYRDGIPIANSVQGKISFLVDVEPQDEWQIRNALLRKSRLTEYQHVSRLQV